MNLRALTTPACLLALAFVVACDDPPKKDPSATAKPSATPTPSATATASVAAAVPTAKKKIVDCPTSGDPVIADKALETEVRKKLGKDSGAVTITKTDLASIKSINLTSAAVNDLDPCIFPLLTGMKDLFLGQGDLEDLTPLSTLSGLMTLRAAINKVSDIKALSGLTKMDRLDLGRSQVMDLTPVANMTVLTELQLDETPVADLSPLHACTKLEKISIKQTRVKDVSPLKDLKKLRFLYVEGAPIENANVLDGLVNNGLRIVRTGNR
jgi:internalin A